MRFLFQNLSLKLLALLLASFLWVFVIISSNQQKTFPTEGGLTPEIFNLPENLVVTNQITPVTLRINTDQKTFQSLSPEDFSVFLDVQNLPPGTHTIRVSATTNQNNVNIQRISPPSLELTLSEISEKTVPVSVEIKGQPYENFTTEEPILEFTTVKIQGPQNLIEKASEAVALISLQGNEKKDILKTWPLEIRDTAGKPLPTLTPLRPRVAVTLPLKQVSVSKTVGVKVVLSGAEENQNYYVSSITSDPLSVEIRGNANTLKTISSIETEPIDVSNLTRNATRTVKWNLPENVSLAEKSPPFAVILLEVTSYDSIREVSAPINLEPKPNNFTTSPTSITLRLSGPIEKIDQLLPTDSYINLDTSNLSTETQTMLLSPEQFTIPDELTLLEFSPQEITLTPLSE